MSRKVVVFGYGKFGRNIARTLRDEHDDLLLVVPNETKYERARSDGFAQCLLLDVTDDDALASLPIEPGDQLVSVMDNDHLNVFLVLSLRELYPNNPILAISDSIHATSKLKMAGANKVIDLYNVSANRIHNILSKPIATQFLEGFTRKDHAYSFREITIPPGSFLDGKLLDAIDFRRYGVIFVGMIDLEKGNHFIFVTVGINHVLDSGDILVCIGEEEDLDRFEAAIAQSQEAPIDAETIASELTQKG
jgi:voltage-gated potassium channel